MISTDDQAVIDVMQEFAKALRNVSPKSRPLIFSAMCALLYSEVMLVGHICEGFMADPPPAVLARMDDFLRLVREQKKVAAYFAPGGCDEIFHFLIAYVSIAGTNLESVHRMAEIWNQAGKDEAKEKTS